MASCQYKKELFTAMFPGGVPENFSLSPAKAHYFITKALGPSFKNMLLQDFIESDVLLSYSFDDTSNVDSKKKLQLRIRYW